MVTAEVICQGIRMVLAVNLKLVLILNNHISYHVIDLKSKILICIKIDVAYTVTVIALEVILFCDTSLSILRRLNHLGFDALFAGSFSTANHEYRLA